MKPGDFVWYDICTPDTDAAATFYTHVVGWTAAPSGVAGVDYTLFSIGDRPVAGLFTLPPEQMPPRPVWSGYIAAGDVDAKAAEVSGAGGAVHRAPQDIPSVGRFAVVADPQGAVFVLFRGQGEPPPPLGMMQGGSVGWHELHTSSQEDAWSFYAGMFGWTKDAAHEAGPAGTYQTFKTSGMPCGGMITDARAPHPFWLFYFVVDALDPAIERVKSGGGQILFGPQEVPGGAWIVNAQDPQGGIFALVSIKRS